MPKLSSKQVAILLGINPGTLTRYIKAGKVVAPKETLVGGMRMRLWTERDITRLRDALPKIANGRKTRYKKQGVKQTTRKPK